MNSEHQSSTEDSNVPNRGVPNRSYALHALLTPAAFPHPILHIETVETHISWIVLTGTLAYKIKKSVRFDFIDTMSLAQRKHLCEEEVRLNRRLSPELYLDVVPITEDTGGLRVGGAGVIVEYAVRMKQFDRSQELAALLDRDTVKPSEIVAFAKDIARFHNDAAIVRSTGEFVATKNLRNAVMENLSALEAYSSGADAISQLNTLFEWTHDALQRCRPELRKREQDGFVRECHGDLHAGNIVRWRDRLTAFDCLEFNPDLRCIDVMSDVAFLFADLCNHQRKDLAFLFLNTYVEVIGDYSGLKLLSFYAVYRAMVRAKIDALSCKQQPARRADFDKRLRSYIATAAALIDELRATLFIMHGFSGSGKSWLSERVALPLCALRVRSDIERKRLAQARGADSTRDTAHRDIYSREFTRDTYRRLVDCAENCLLGGINIIVDAAFLKSVDRMMFQDLAARCNAGYAIVSCTADIAVMKERIDARQKSKSDPSDADIAVLQQQLEKSEPLTASELPHVISAHTDHSTVVADTLKAIREKLHQER